MKEETNESANIFFASSADEAVTTKVREEKLVGTADDDEDRLWQVTKKCRTQRIMEKAQVEGQ